MALFKLRKGSPEPVAAAPQPESIEAMRRRARHRLIGAALLVLVGVVGFPLLFDTQPRPIAVDIPIDIPDRNKVKPLQLPASAPVALAPAALPSAPSAVGVPGPAGAASTPVAAASRPADKTPAAAVEARPAASKPVAATKVETKPEPKPAPKVDAGPAVAAPPAKADDGARAQALLEGRPAASAAAGEARFVVQVGAFADPNKARDTRLKVERAGLKTYTHVAETKDGRRIRVRVGPFASRAEADKAAEKIKGLDLPAAILIL